MPFFDKGNGYLIDARVTLGIVGGSGLTPQLVLAGTRGMATRYSQAVLNALYAGEPLNSHAQVYPSSDVREAISAIECLENNEWLLSRALTVGMP